MTRKRFKKLCMGYCVSRDSSDALAFVVWLFYPSSAAAWPTLRAKLSDALADVRREIAEQRAAEEDSPGGGNVHLADKRGEDVGPYGEEAPRCE